jgi:hypothetical protein
MRELGRHQIRRLGHADPDPGVAETAMPAHLCHANVIVPVGDRPVASVGLETDTFQAKGWCKDDGDCEAVQRDDICAVEDLKTGVEFTRTPALKWRFVNDRRRQCDESANIQRAIRPTIETMSDPGRDCVIDRRMT